MKKPSSTAACLIIGILTLIAILSRSEAATQYDRTTLKPLRPSGVVERCSAIIVGKKATKDGSVILAHNEDLQNFSAHHFLYQPHITHGQGKIFTSYWGAEIPQVSETYAYSATKIFDKSYSPGDITSGINEHQVAVANDMAELRDAPVELPTKGRIIWTEMTQLALERSKTAREAVKVIGDMVHTYKLGSDSGTMFAVTDINEGWWVEVTLEGQWVAQRVPDNTIGFRANMFRIGEVNFNDPDNFMFSDDLVEYAKKMGWYDGKGAFNFTKIYAPENPNETYSSRRHWRAEELLQKQVGSITPKDIMAVLRDHYEGTKYDLTNNYKKGSPHHTNERTICSINTEVSVVTQSRGWLPAEIGALSWRAMTTPCTSAYTPWYLGSKDVPAAYRTGTNQYTKNSSYWTFRNLSRHTDISYRTLIAKTRKQIEGFEKQELEAQTKIEKEAMTLYSRNKDSVSRFLTKYSNDKAMQAMRLGNSLVKQ
jgi:dipeptidase